MVEERGSPLVSQPSALGRKRSSSRSRRATASPSSRRSVVSTDATPSSAARASPASTRASGRRYTWPARFDAERDDAVGVRVERRLELRRPLDRGLSVVRVEDHGVALEERVGAAGGVEQRLDRGVGACQRDVLGALRPVRVRCVVEVREVVREEVEAVARDEPAPDCGGVRVDRPAGPVAHCEPRARRVGLEEAVVEEPLRPVRRLRHPRKRRQMLRAAAVARDVHRCASRARRPRGPRRRSRRRGRGASGSC